MMESLQSNPLSFLDHLTEKPYLAYLSLFVTGFSLPLGMVLAQGIPYPQIQDEFSYLLMADTFASGRLANPPHPLADYLETFHVLVEPTYASKYFPLQGLILALGMLLGHPIIAVWLMSGLMGCALYYTASNLIPRNLAWAAAFVMLLHFGINSNWAYNYWGGLGFCISGLLVMGGSFAQWRNPSWQHGLLLGLGTAGIILSRPLEGFLYCLPFAAMAAVCLVRYRDRSAIFLRIALPPVACIILALGFLGIYNNAVTGNPFLLPHTAYHEQYLPDLKRLAWDNFDLQPVEDRSERFNRFVELFNSLEPATTTDRIESMTDGIQDWLKFYLPWSVVLLAAFMFAGAGHLPRPLLPLVFSLLALRLAILPVSAWNGHLHYTGAWAGMSLGIFSGGLLVATHLIGKGVRLILSGVVGILLLSYILALFTPWDPGMKLHTSYSDYKYGEARHRVKQDLLKNGDYKHVVLVKYRPDHTIEAEWVYNGANVDTQSIIWLTWLGDGTLEEIRDYYPGRVIWLLESPGTRGMFEMQLLSAPQLDP